MKKFILIFNCLPWLCAAQSLITLTVLPAQPTTQDSIQIIVETMTPNQGHKLSRSAAVSKTGLVTIEICNYDGMLTATESYVDTFKVGQLAAGIWSVQVNYNLSADPQSCNSKMEVNAAYQFTVHAVTQISENLLRRLRVYPNPVSQELFIPEGFQGTLLVKDLKGKTVLEIMADNSATFVDVSKLPAGTYLLCDTRQQLSPAKFIVER